MIKKIALIFGVLLACGVARADGVRVSNQVTQKGTIFRTTNAVLIPYSPQIHFCSAPANAVPCTNYATTYTSSTLGTACPSNAQLVLDGSTTCTALTDNQDNWGVWVASGQYTYTVTILGTNYGPYYVTAGGSGGGGGGIGGSIANTQVAVGTGANIIGGSNALLYNGTTLSGPSFLVIGSQVGSYPATIASDGNSLIQIVPPNTGANNGYIWFHTGVPGNTGDIYLYPLTGNVTMGNGGTLQLKGLSTGAATIQASNSGNLLLLNGSNASVSTAGLGTFAGTVNTGIASGNQCIYRDGAGLEHGTGAPCAASTGIQAILYGGTGASTAANALINLFPTATRAGDIIYWDGSIWNHLAGNNSGTQCSQENSSGVPSWGACGGSAALSSLTAAVGANTIANGNNKQTWNWLLTGASSVGFQCGETSASTGGTALSQILCSVDTVAGSTAVPFGISNSLTGSQVLPAFYGHPTWNTSGVATSFLWNLTNTASGAGSKIFDWQVGGATKFNSDVAGNAVAATSFSVPADGVHPGNSQYVGNTTIVTPASNTANIMGPNAATFTAYGLQLPLAAPSVISNVQIGAVSSAVSQITITSPAFAAQTDGATVTWAIGSQLVQNASLTFTVHSGSRTLNITNPVNGGSYVLKVIQDGTGGEGLTLGTGCTWKVSGGGSGAVTPSTGANAIDILAFTYDGTNCYANFNKNFN